jgi:hypothetical protein
MTRGTRWDLHQFRRVGMGNHMTRVKAFCMLKLHFILRAWNIGRFNVRITHTHMPPSMEVCVHDQWRSLRDCLTSYIKVT